MNLHPWSYIARCWFVCRWVQLWLHNERKRFIATHLILEEGVPNIFCHSGRTRNVARAFLVALGVDAIV